MQGGWNMQFPIRLILLFLALAPVPLLAELIVPGMTAYGVPDAQALRVDQQRGVVDWKDPAQKVVWYGKFANAGALSVFLEVLVAEGKQSKFKLGVGKEMHQITVQGTTKPQQVEVGKYTIVAPGYVALTLESLNAAGEDAGEIRALKLSGEASLDAHFNLLERRNAASVHLAYQMEDQRKAALFYNEVTAVEEPIHTFYMACGFSRGYLGMQINSPTERRVIFSVWDSGKGQNANNRKEVPEENRTKMLAKGEGVVGEVFGGEGTGGHSHFVYPWKTGQAQKFIVTAEPDATSTIYAGYWFHPEQQKWMLLAKFHAPHDGEFLRGLHSFSENFGGANGHLLRKALYGPQWIRDSNGDWQELLTATFSHDPTGNKDRLDRFMGMEDGKFFLSHGGFVDGYCKFGDPFTRLATKQPPEPVLP